MPSHATDVFSPAIQLVLLNISHKFSISRSAVGICSDLVDALLQRLLVELYKSDANERDLESVQRIAANLLPNDICDEAHELSLESQAHALATVSSQSSTSSNRSGIDESQYNTHEAELALRHSANVAVSDVFAFSAALLKRRAAQILEPVVQEEIIELTHSVPLSSVLDRTEENFAKRRETGRDTRFSELALSYCGACLQAFITALLRECIERVERPALFPDIARRPREVNNFEIDERVIHEATQDATRVPGRIAAKLVEPVADLHSLFKEALLVIANENATASDSSSTPHLTRSLEESQQSDATASATSPTRTDSPRLQKIPSTTSLQPTPAPNTQEMPEMEQEELVTMTKSDGETPKPPDDDTGEGESDHSQQLLLPEVEDVERESKASVDRKVESRRRAKVKPITLSAGNWLAIVVAFLAFLLWLRNRASK